MWLLVVAAAQLQFRFADGADHIVWEPRPNQVCTGFDINPARSTDFVKAARCAGNPSASGFMNDDENSDALCLDEAACKALCAQLDECLGIDMHNTRERCTLNNWECAGRVAEGTLTYSADHSIHIKQVPWTAECPKGLYVKVDGGGNHVDGDYKPVEGDASTYKSDANPAVRVHWDGCQWDVQKHHVPTPINEPAPATCLDDTDAVNYLFGRKDDDYDDHLCAMGENAGYCASALFAGVCPATCNVPVQVCHGDNKEAANHLAELWEVSAVGCALCEKEGRDDPVVESVCKDSCPAVRRLTPSPADTTKRSFDLMDYAQVGHSLRRLDGHGEWEDYFWSQYGQVGWKPDCQAKSADITLLNDHSLCDVQKFEQPVEGLSLRAECPLQQVYETVSGQYCPLQHVSLEEADVQVQGKPVSEHRCYAKCRPGAADPDGHTEDPDCAGNDPFFLEDSQALCLERAACEEACSGIGDCVSVDMHRSLPRCYLNRACAGQDADPDYNLLVKDHDSLRFDTTADAYCDFGDASLLPGDGYKTEATDWNEQRCLHKCNPFSAPCDEAAQPFGCFCDGVVGLGDSPSDDTALCLPRELCEQACAELDGCASFDMHQGSNRCYLNAVPLEGCPADQVVHDVAYEVVTKVAALPCFPVLEYVETQHNADDHHRVDGLTGDYSAIEVTPLGTTYDLAAAGARITFDGCWKVYAGTTWLFSSVPMVDGGDHCVQHEPEVLTPGYHVNELFFAGCPHKQDMSITRTCLGFSDCPVLTRCVVTEARFDAEVHALPFDANPGYDAQNTGYFGLENCGEYAASKQLLSAKQLASPTRAEYVIAPTLYGEHFIEHRVYRDEPEAPQVTFTAASGSDKFVITARPVPPTTELPAGYAHFASDVIDIEALDVLRLGDRVECAAAHSNLHIVMGVVDPSAGYHIFPVHRDSAGALHFDSASPSTPGCNGNPPLVGKSGCDEECVGLAFVPVAGICTGCKQNGDPITRANVGGLSPPAEMCLPTEGERAIHVNANGHASVVAVADHDECLDGSHECSATSECVNTVGSYYCACLAGHSRHDGSTEHSDRLGASCRKDAFECPEISVRVSAADAFEVGWRIREVTLFSDDACTTPAATPKTDQSDRRRRNLGAADPAAQPLTMEAYTTVSYHQCAGPEIAVWNHPREIVRASQCFAKCRGAERGARKLSPKRRMQLDPTDWNNCQGASYGPATRRSDKNDNALCASVETCQSICSQLHDCAGFSYVDYACVLHSACEPEQYTGSGYWARAVKKEPVVKVSSSHGEHVDRMRLHEGWAEHPVSLITDGFGQPGHAGVDFTNTEWWSQCWSCAAEEAWVELTVRPDGDCHVHSVQVLQDAEQEHSARRLNFAVGAGPFTRGPRPDASRELAQIGTYFSSWQYPKRDDDCYALTCGEPGMYSGETIRSVESVASPCLCKQLCLETAGCEVYNLYKEADNHWDSDTSADDHEHWFCYLIGADWQAADVATEHWTRGTVDTTLQGFVRTGGLGNFDLEVHGYHLSDSNARLKIVKWRDAADNCADPLADTVGGIGCSDSFICAPKPAKFDRDHADWVGLSIAQGAEDQDYRVCYCKGPCYAGWQYSPVGTEPLEVAGVGYGWRLADPAKCSVDRDADGIVLEVSRPIFHSLSDSADWAVKLVAATDTCADAAPQSGGVDRLAVSDVGQELDNRTYELEIVNERATAGRYIVCLAEDGANFVEIDGLDCGRYLDVQFIAEDLEAPEGYFTGQRFSAAAGEPEASITVKGNFPGWDGKTRVAISDGDMGDLGYMVLGDFDSFHNFILPLTETWSDGEVAMTFNATTLEAGTHSVLVQYTCRQNDAGCIADFPQYGKCKQSDPGDNHAGVPGGHADLVLHQCEIGKLTASARVDQGWTYVLDPTTEGSIEVTGEGLDWKKDRIMLVDCEATCGVSSPAGVHLEGSAQTLLGANTFVAQNGHFDRPSDDVEPTVDLPSELRTYTTAIGAYCVGHNMAAGTQVAAGAFHHDQCYNKCAACTQAGTPCPASCRGYLELQDGPGSGALCMTEVECRTLCTATEGCVGIDMYRTSDRCYLNAATPQPGDQTEAPSCGDQFESGHLGVHPDYKYLHLHRGHARARALSSGLSHSRLLRFAPVSFSGGGSYKVCFCDHELLPDGQEHCLAEADYSIEIGKVYASGVSCLLAEDKFRRGTCHEQHHGGLACSELLTRHGADAEGASAGLPSAYDLY